MRSDQGFNLFLTLAKDVLLIPKQPKEKKRKEKELVFGSVDKGLVSFDPLTSCCCSNTSEILSHMTLVPLERTCFVHETRSGGKLGTKKCRDSLASFSFFLNFRV